MEYPVPYSYKQGHQDLVLMEQQVDRVYPKTLDSYNGTLFCQIFMMEDMKTLEDADEEKDDCSKLLLGKAGQHQAEDKEDVQHNTKNDEPEEQSAGSEKHTAFCDECNGHTNSKGKGVDRIFCKRD